MVEPDTLLADALERAGLTLAEVCKRPRRPRGPTVPRVRPSVDVALSAVRAQTRADVALSWSVDAATLDTIADTLAAERIGEPTKALLATYRRGLLNFNSGKTLKALAASADRLELGPQRVGWPPLVTGDADADAEGFRALREAATPPITFDYLEGEAGARIPVYVGNLTTIFVPAAVGLERLPARYVLLPLSGIVPSHNPNGFAPSAAYPPQLQERDYSRDKNEQAKVLRNAARFEPALVLNSNPDAINGPPIIDADGFVLGGNSRTMSILLYAQGNPAGWGEALRKALGEHCGVFGVPEVPDPQNWILARVLMGEYDEATISRLLNRAFTGAMGEAATATSAGKMLPAELLELLGDALEDSSLDAALTSAGASIGRILLESGYWLPTEAAAMVRGNGQLTPAARLSLEGAILGAAVQDRDLLGALTPAMRDVIGRIAPVLIALEGDPAAREKGASIAPGIRAALGYANRLLLQEKRERHGYILTLPMFDDPVRDRALSSLDHAAWVLWLMRASVAPSVATRRVFAYFRAVRRLLDTSQGGLDLFGLDAPSIAEIRPSLLDLPDVRGIDERPDVWLADRMTSAEVGLHPLRRDNPASVVVGVVNVAQAITALAWLVRSVAMLGGNEP